MVLKELEWYMQKKMILDHQLTPYTRMNWKWVKYLNISHNTIKVLEENIGSKFSDIPCSNIFTDISSRAVETKEKINKWDYIKLKSSAQQRKPSSKWKGNTLDGRIYLPITHQTRVWYPKYIRTQMIQHQEDKQSNQKMGKGTGHLSKEDIQITHRQMKGCSASLAIRETQIKTTMRYRLTPIRMAIINESISSRCWRGCGEKGALAHCWWECRLVRPLWKEFNVSSQN